jgi:hypothetical protein
MFDNDYEETEKLHAEALKVAEKHKYVHHPDALEKQLEKRCRL